MPSILHIVAILLSIFIGISMLWLSLENLKLSDPARFYVVLNLHQGVSHRISIKKIQETGNPLLEQTKKLQLRRCSDFDTSKDHIPDNSESKRNNLDQCLTIVSWPNQENITEEACARYLLKMEPTWKLLQYIHVEDMNCSQIRDRKAHIIRALRVLTSPNLRHRYDNPDLYDENLIMKKNPWEVLGVKKDASIIEMRESYRNILLRLQQKKDKYCDKKYNEANNCADKFCEELPHDVSNYADVTPKTSESSNVKESTHQNNDDELVDNIIETKNTNTKHIVAEGLCRHIKKELEMLREAAEILGDPTALAVYLNEKGSEEGLRFVTSPLELINGSSNYLEFLYNAILPIVVLFVVIFYIRVENEQRAWNERELERMDLARKANEKKIYKHNNSIDSKQE